MYCKRCHIRMEEQKRSFHKQHKWTCPKCGRSRMQQMGRKKEGRRPREY
jgi:hypothetical protein